MKINFSNIDVNSKLFVQELSKSKNSLETLLNKNGLGNEFTGWVNLASSIDANTLNEYENTAKQLSVLDCVVVIGIGGSYLGSKAILESFKNPFETINPRILFAGFNLCDTYHSQLLDYLKDKDFGIIVISKSGTTTEPAIAFRLLKQELEKRLTANEISKRIIAITDKEKGALNQVANKYSYKTFVIPNNIGGRFSIFTPVGLLPLAISGINIRKLVAGAKNAENLFLQNTLENPAIQYASTRNFLYNQGKSVELLTSFHPQLKYIAEWWKQLFGESEGKEHKGLFPTSATFSTDLHSLGQFVQEGKDIFFESVITVSNSEAKIKIPNDKDNLDNLNYLENKDLSWINKMAEEGTILAHEQGNVPMIKFEIEKINEFCIGKLLNFFMISCAISAYSLDVNPFNQPGVEAYKNNMFKLLGKDD